MPRGTTWQTLLGLKISLFQVVLGGFLHDSFTFYDAKGTLFLPVLYVERGYMHSAFHSSSEWSNRTSPLDPRECLRAAQFILSNVFEC